MRALGRRLLKRLTAIPVRYKLLAMALTPVVLVFPILVWLLVVVGNRSYDQLLIAKVKSDLVVAGEYFDRVLTEHGREVEALAGSHALAQAAGRETPLLAQRVAERGFDFLILRDAAGEIVASYPRVATDRLRDSNVVARARSGRSLSAVDIVDGALLAGIQPALQQRAYVALVDTPNAAPTDRTAETRGMILHSAAPVVREGRVVGVVEGGTLLNGNLAFVDRINEIAYGRGSLPLGSQGTATLFLEDVRIATNVRLFHGERALGTRVSQAVRDRVLGEGKAWHDKAFVVSDWFVSGYQPIHDSSGRRVGMFYVGFLEEPFRHAKTVAVLVLVGLFAGVSLLGSLMALRGARAIFAPLERMNATMATVEGGAAGARVGPVASRDEIGALARHFDELLDALERRNAELKAFADELDRKVIERTRELAEANEHLRAAQQQLVMSEKLAAIGQLTAGVAHEINNPIAVMQGNIDVVREVVEQRLGVDAAEVRQEIGLIDEQINRIRIIVTKLLQFARPEQFAGYVEAVDVNQAVQDCLVLTRHERTRAEIVVRTELAATRRVNIARTELQQVLINLLVNAGQAVETRPAQGGAREIHILTADDARDGVPGVTLKVCDNGPGIAPAHLARVFDAFFTTKKTQGTGLGLSISATLVQRYGGTLAAYSPRRDGQAGSEFEVWLRVEPRFSEITIPLPHAA